MSNNTHYFRQKIKGTEAYQSMSKLQKTVSTMRSNVKAIEHSLKVVENVGFDQWSKQTQSNYLNRLIIKELTEKK